MEQTLPHEGNVAGSFPGYVCSARSLLAAAGVCLLAVLLVFLTHGYKQVPDRENGRQEAFRFVSAALDDELQRGLALAQGAAAGLAGLKPQAASELARRESVLWPAARIDLYNERGGIAGSESAASAPASPASMATGVFNLVQKAQRGQTAVSLVEEEGGVAVAAAAPVAGSDIKCVLVSQPLTMAALLRIKERTGSDVAVLIPDMTRKSGMIATFDEAQELLPSQQLLHALAGKTGPVRVPVHFADGERMASVCLASGEQGADAAILVVVPGKATAGSALQVPETEVLVLALLGALVVFILFSYTHFRRERAYRASIASELAQFAVRGRLPVHSQLPSALQGALGAIAGDLEKCKAIAGKASEERDEARRRLEGIDQAPSTNIVEPGYKTFFADADAGFFLINESGAILQVNTCFAFMLGYDSPTHLLSEKSTLPALCRSLEEGTALLALLRETPHRKFVVTLRRRDGKLYEATASSLGIETADGAASATIAGMITDNALEEQNNQLLWENRGVKQRSENLALLLAATCRQVQAYILSSIPAGGELRPLSSHGPGGQSDGDLKGGAACPSTGLRELPASVNAGGKPFGFSVITRVCAEKGQHSLAQQSVFDDVYHIALEEAQENKTLLVPMGIADVLEYACLQALPILEGGGTMLFREVEKDLPPQVSGPAVVLRHTLLRTLLEVAGAMQGGHAFLSAVRDPNSPVEAGRIKLLFSASWTSELADEEVPGIMAVDKGEAGAPARDTMHGAAGAFSKADLGFSLAERRSILLFLVQKMHGEVLQSSFTEKTRSVQFTAPFDAMMGGSFQASSAPTERSLAADSSAVAHGSSQIDSPEAAEPFVALHEEEADSYVSAEDDLDVLEPFDDSGYADASEAPLAAEEDAVVHLLNMDPGVQGDDPDIDDSLDILLIDDSMNNRLLFSMFLRDTRHRITEAHNGQEGVEAFQNQRFDVIFMDMEMPLMNGYQATRIIRAMEADAGMEPTPIVAQTAHVLPDFKYQCMLSGCTEFLGKPFSKNALLTMIKAFSRLKRERMRAASEAPEWSAGQ